MEEDIKNSFFIALLNSDRILANEIIENWAKKKNYHSAVCDILEPSLKILGEKWIKNDEITFAQAFISAKIAEDILMKSLQEINTDDSFYKKQGNIVIGNIEDDYHSLGRKLLGIFLQSSGWNVFDLGNDVSPKEFVDKAIESDSKIICASAMMYSTALNIKNLRSEIDNRNLKNKLMLAVGGAVFNLHPELVDEVGGDGTSKNALDAVVLMKNLLGEVNKRGTIKV